MNTKDKYIQKLEELVSAYKNEPITGNYDEDRDYGNYIEKLESELSSLKADMEKEKKPKKESKIKICAACGSFAHGNPGHDISI